jgi:flagellar FliJ protein
MSGTMARFRYSLQSILDIKLKMETQAKQEFSAAANALNEENARLEALKSKLEGLQDEAVGLLDGTLNIRDIEDNKQAMSITKEKILIQQDNVRMAQKKLDAARENLTEVMKERKTHETLKEKAFEEFMREENRAESKSVDELTSYTYGQKKAESKA